MWRFGNDIPRAGLRRGCRFRFLPINRVDHIEFHVGNVELGAMNRWVEFFAQTMVMMNGNGKIKFPINEPAEGRRCSRTIRFWPTTPGCRSAITGGPRRSSSAGLRPSHRMASSGPRRTHIAAGRIQYAIRRNSRMRYVSGGIASLNPRLPAGTPSGVLSKGGFVIPSPGMMNGKITRVIPGDEHA